jgi:hypothetical protein
MKKKTLWRWWAKSLGQKATKNDREADHVAIIRTIIFGTYLFTNLFIVAGVIRHWNDNQPIEIYIHNEVPSTLSEAKKEDILKANRNFLYD